MGQEQEQDDCERCGGWKGEDPALKTMRRYPRGSIGWQNAMSSWSGEPCECVEYPKEGRFKIDWDGSAALSEHPKEDG